MYIKDVHEIYFEKSTWILFTSNMYNVIFSSLFQCIFHVETTQTLLSYRFWNGTIFKVPTFQMWNNFSLNEQINHYLQHPSMPPVSHQCVHFNLFNIIAKENKCIPITSIFFEHIPNIYLKCDIKKISAMYFFLW